MAPLPLISDTQPMFLVISLLHLPFATSLPACLPACCALHSGMAGQGPSAPPAGGAAAPSDPGASLAAALLAAMARQQQQQQLAAMARAPGPGLSEVLKPEVLAPLLQDPEVGGLGGGILYFK